MNQLPIEMLLDLKHIMYLQKIANNSDCFIFMSRVRPNIACFACIVNYAASMSIDVAKKINSVRCTHPDDERFVRLS